MWALTSLCPPYLLVPTVGNFNNDWMFDGIKRLMGFPGDAVIMSLPMQETQVQALGWEDPLEEETQLAPVFLPGESHGQRNLVDYSPWGRKKM